MASICLVEKASVATPYPSALRRSRNRSRISCVSLTTRIICCCFLFAICPTRRATNSDIFSYARAMPSLGELALHHTEEFVDIEWLEEQADASFDEIPL